MVLAFRHGKLGLLLRHKQDTAVALTHFRTARTILEPLVARFPDHPRWRQASTFVKGQIEVIEAAGSKRGKWADR